MKALKALYYISITIVAFVALVFVVSTFPITGNYDLLIVDSGSMEPAIKTGALVMVKPVNNYEIGDVVTYKPRGGSIDEPITHRIEDIEVVEGNVRYITKGDANEEADPQSVRKSDVIGKVLLDVPYLGYGVDFVQKPIGFILIIAIPALIIIGDEIKKIVEEIKKPKDNRTKENDENDQIGQNRT